MGGHGLGHRLADFQGALSGAALWHGLAGWVGHLMTDFKRYYPAHFTNLFVGREDESEAPVNDGGVDYDAVSIYSIRDDAALDELLQIASNPEFTRAVTLDEANFADRGASRQSITEEAVGPGLI